MDLLEPVQSMANKMITGLEPLSYEEKAERAGVLDPREEKILR